MLQYQCSFSRNESFLDSDWPQIHQNSAGCILLSLSVSPFVKFVGFQFNVTNRRCYLVYFAGNISNNSKGAGICSHRLCLMMFFSVKLTVIFILNTKS